jgi:hypothetical protein
MTPTYIHYCLGGRHDGLTWILPTCSDVLTVDGVRYVRRGEARSFEYPPAWVPWGAEPDYFRVDMEIER